MPVSNSGLLLPGGAPEPIAPQQPDPTTPVECITAFVVFQLPDGDWQASAIDTAELKQAREVTFDDMTAGCANLLQCLDVSYLEGEIEVITAFVVFQLVNGLWQLAPSIVAPLIPARPARGSDMLGGLAVAMRDVHTQEIAQATAQATVNAQFQLGQAVAEQRQQAMLQQQLAADKDKLRRGGR